MTTLGQLWRDHLRDALASRPARRGLTSARTIAEYETAVKLWVELTGDPPIHAITPQTVSDFLRLLIQQNGRSLATINKFCRELNALFGMCGKPSFRNPDRLGIVDDAPWIKPPRLPRCAGRPAYRLEHLEALIQQCRKINQISGFPAPYATSPVPIGAWWEGLLVMAYNTGLRREALLKFRRSYLVDGCWAEIPASDSKTGIAYRIYLNASARVILDQMPSQDPIFTFSASAITLDRQRRAIVSAAGVPDYGLHGLRRTLATELRRLPGGETVARIMLGHAPLDVNDRHYSDWEQLIPEVMEKLPQPRVSKG